jgi:hypothetical protein
MSAPATRLRQVALVASDLDATCAAIERELGLRDPFDDPGVGEFGLRNAVYELGDTFLEVVSPLRNDTTAGRYLERRGGDAGYMALFQVPDTEATRALAGELGLRIVWQIDLPDISGTHLHPRDVPGAIVSFDTPLAPETWRWGGPRWTSAAPSDAVAEDGIVAITVRLVDVAHGSAVWQRLLSGAPGVRFEAAASDPEEGIAEVHVGRGGVDATICGVRFRSAA